MTRAVSAEFLKLRTTRTFWSLTLVAVGLVALVASLTLAFDEATGEDDLRSLLSFSGTGGIVVLILGVIGMAGEFRHSTIGGAFLAMPRRPRVVAAKAIAFALAGVAVGVACTAVAYAITFAWLAADGVDIALSGTELARIVAGGLVYSALAGAFGVGVGTLITNQVVAVIAILVALFVIDPLLVGVVDATTASA